MWVVVKIVVPFWVPNILGLVFRVPKKDHNFDNHPCVWGLGLGFTRV